MINEAANRKLQLKYPACNNSLHVATSLGAGVFYSQLCKYCRPFLLFSFFLLLSLFAKSQTSIGCDGYSYLIESTGTGTVGSPFQQYLIQLSLQTDSAKIVDSAFDGNFAPNAMGYNPIDGNLWGYSHGSRIFEFTGPVNALTYTTIKIPGLPSAVYNNGDVSASGVLYLYASNTTEMYEVNINVGSGHYLQLDSITVAPLNITDFSFNPIDSDLYAVTSATSSHVLEKINPVTGAETVVGNAAVAGLTSFESYGASYFDAAGNYYIQSNGSGIIYRINSVATITNTTTPAATAVETAASSGNSDGARCNQAPVLLPVKLVSFTGLKSGYTTVLSWQTSLEVDFRDFEIEYASDSVSFVQIGTVYSSGKPTGNSYDFLYDQPVGVGYYGLKIVNTDGSFQYSDIVIIQNGSVATPHISLYPNPSTSSVIVRGLVANDLIRLVDMTGRVLTQVTTVDDAKQIDISNYPSGFYMVQVIDNDNIVSNLKLDKID